MITKFISVGENIHCTRVYKTDGKFVVPHGGGYAITYESDGRKCHLPIPPAFVEHADWAAGRLKHCAVAVWQGMRGKPEDAKSAVDYIRHLAKVQAAAGATYLDVNVDEFSTDVEERTKAIAWVIKIVEGATSLPVSVDSSNTAILKAGLAACTAGRGSPLLNSVSLERPAAVALAAEFKAAVIASAAGENDLPCTTADKLANLNRIVPMLMSAGIPKGAIHCDPLVFPISTDPSNGKAFLDAVKAVREKYGPEIHIVAGLSNVSFGMPSRKLLNQVFTLLALDAGADGGIVDPLQINIKALNGLDRKSNGFEMARAALMGEDEFAMNFIMASREGGLE